MKLTVLVFSMDSRKVFGQVSKYRDFYLVFILVTFTFLELLLNLLTQHTEPSGYKQVFKLNMKKLQCF